MSKRHRDSDSDSPFAGGALPLSAASAAAPAAAPRSARVEQQKRNIASNGTRTTVDLSNEIDEKSNTCLPNSTTLPSPAIDYDERDTALLVLHYLRTEFPGVEKLFRLETKSLLQGHDALMIPRSLRSILSEYRHLKSRELAQRQLLTSIQHYSNVTQTPSILTTTLNNMVTIVDDYVWAREAAEANRQVMPPIETMRPTMEQMKAILTTTTVNAPPPTPTITPSSDLPVPILPSSSVGATGPSVSVIPSSTIAAATKPSAEAALNEAKRRRKGSPKRRVMTSNTSHAAAAAASAAVDTVGSTVVASVPPVEYSSVDNMVSSGLDSPTLFQFPTSIPLPNLGPDAVAHMEVNPEGYSMMFDEHGGLAFPEALAKFINQANRNTTTAATAAATTNPTTLVSSLSNGSGVDSSGPLDPSPTGGAPSFSLSHDMMLSIAEQCLSDPVAAQFMDGAFAARVDLPDENTTPGASTNGPNTPFDANEQTHTGATGSAALTRTKSNSQSATTVAHPSIITPRRTSSRLLHSSPPHASSSTTTPRRSPQGVGISRTSSSHAAHITHGAMNVGTNKKPISTQSTTTSTNMVDTTTTATMATSSNTDNDVGDGDLMPDDIDLLAALGTLNDENVDEYIASIREKDS